MLLIKVGGGKNINWDYVCEDIADVVKDEPIILVHGASTKRDEIAQQLGCPSKVVTAPSGIQSIYTDQKALEIFLMVYAGLINKQIVVKLQKSGVNAVGLSGVDGRLWEGKRKSTILVKDGDKTKVISDNLTGRVEKINSDLIKILIDHSYTPVICSPAISYDNEIINTDNDWATAVMAGALGISRMVVLFEAPGLLRNHNDENSLIKKVSRDQLDECLQYAQGRMKKKILGVKKAIEMGIREIYFGDARIKNPVKNALSGNGTVIN